MYHSHSVDHQAGSSRVFIDRGLLKRHCGGIWCVAILFPSHCHVIASKKLDTREEVVNSTYGAMMAFMGS